MGKPFKNDAEELEIVKGLNRSLLIMDNQQRTEIDRLRAELAAISVERDRLVSTGHSVAEERDEFRAELAAKDARITELEADKVRWRQQLNDFEQDCKDERARAEAMREALLYNAESQYCAGMSAGFELGRNDDRAELSRIITQRWKEIADAKASAALAPSPAGYTHGISPGGSAEMNSMTSGTGGIGGEGIVDDDLSPNSSPGSLTPSPAGREG